MKVPQMTSFLMMKTSFLSNKTRFTDVEYYTESFRNGSQIQKVIKLIHIKIVVNYDIISHRKHPKKFTQTQTLTHTHTHTHTHTRHRLNSPNIFSMFAE
jgi:hypothetical protein